METFLLSTIGTNLLTNGATPYISELIRKYANTTYENNVPEDERDAISKRIENLGNTLVKSPDTMQLHSASAELNGILSIYSDNMDSASNDHHYLLISDTWLGKMTGSLVERWLKQNGVRNITVSNISGLRTDSLENFQLALSDIVKW